MRNWFKAVGVVFGFLSALALYAFLCYLWIGTAKLLTLAALVWITYIIKQHFDSVAKERVKS